MKIRELDTSERPAMNVPLQAYCFQPSPTTDHVMDRLRTDDAYYADNLTLVAEESGSVIAGAEAVPSRQNVRGAVFAMAGVAGVASLPTARRQGHVRALMTELLGRMRETGCAVSVLYPFRPSFYQRFGYVGVPKPRTVRFSPMVLAPLLRGELPGEIRWERIGSGFDAYRELTHRLLSERHGFAVRPLYREIRKRDADDRWLVTAVIDGEVSGALTYQITGFGGRLVADDLLVANPLARGLLLRFLARHVDQVTEIEVGVPPDELPELWATDFAAVTETRTSFPVAPAPMARVLSLDALIGMPVGPARLTVEIVDDHFINGSYVLDGTTGRLQVSPASGSPEITLTSPGLAGLVYGVLDPADLVVRGFGTVPADTFGELATLFPRALPYFFSRF
jgi:predicted acetyltransferase